MHMPNKKIIYLLLVLIIILQIISIKQFDDINTNIVNMGNYISEKVDNISSKKNLIK